MPPIERDSAELKEILSHHSVAGYHVRVPYIGDAVILRQEGTGPVRRYTDTSVELGSPQVAYVVRPAQPFTFQEWARKKNLSDRPMNLAEWEEKYGKRTRHGILPMLMDMREDLERGALISEAQAEYGLVQNAGCIGPDDTISCATFWSKQVQIVPEMLKPGMLVEYEDKQFTIPGRVVGVNLKKKLALLELFTPAPYLQTPKAIWSEEIKPGFYSSKTFSIGYGLRRGLEDNDVALPPGNVSENEREYVFNELVDLKIFEDFCRKNYPNDAHCVWHAMLLYVLPLHLDGMHAGEFRPLPENMVTSEYIIDYDHE